MRISKTHITRIEYNYFIGDFKDHTEKVWLVFDETRDFDKFFIRVNYYSKAGKFQSVEDFHMNSKDYPFRDEIIEFKKTLFNKMKKKAVKDSLLKHDSDIIRLFNTLRISS